MDTMPKFISAHQGCGEPAAKKTKLVMALDPPAKKHCVICRTDSDCLSFRKKSPDTCTTVCAYGIGKHSLSYILAAPMNTCLGTCKQGGKMKKSASKKCPDCVHYWMLDGSSCG